MMKANDSDHCSPHRASYRDDVEQARAPPQQWLPSTTAGSYLVKNRDSGCLLPSSEEYKVDHPIRTVRLPPRHSHRRRGHGSAARHHNYTDDDDEHDLHFEYEQQGRGGWSGFWTVVCTVTLVVVALVILLPVLLIGPKQENDKGDLKSSKNDEDLPLRPYEGNTPLPTTTHVPVPTLPSSSSPSVTDNLQSATYEEPLTTMPRCKTLPCRSRLLVPPPQLDVDDELRISSVASKNIQNGRGLFYISNTDATTTTSTFTVDHIVTAEIFDSTTVVMDIYNFRRIQPWLFAPAMSLSASPIISLSSRAACCQGVTR